MRAWNSRRRQGTDQRCRAESVIRQILRFWIVHDFPNFLMMMMVMMVMMMDWPHPFS